MNNMSISLYIEQYENFGYAVFINESNHDNSKNTKRSEPGV